MQKVGLVACSNGQTKNQREEYKALLSFFDQQYISVQTSPYLFASNGPFAGTGKQRAAALNELFADSNIEEIYDISGGDMANEVLPYLDFEIIRKSQATFWGYSDLTTVLNAIYTMTEKQSVLYQIKNLVWNCKSLQQERYLHRKQLYELDYRLVQGEQMQGRLVGGNIRCFLKLAGTKYFPDVTGKILLLEAMGGEVPQMVTYLSQLKQLGVFEKIAGLLLGTFSKMQQNQCEPDMITLVKQAVDNKQLPIAKTEEIGHGSNAKAIIIGKEYTFTK